LHNVCYIKLHKLRDCGLYIYTMTIGIYKYMCNDTNETYYGSSMNIEKRDKKHCCNKDNETCSVKIIERDNFTFTIIKTFDKISRLELRKWEQSYIDNDEMCINKATAYSNKRKQIEKKGGGVYLLKCNITGEEYIGSSRDYTQRKYQHKCYKSVKHVKSKQITERCNYEFSILEKRKEINDLDLRKLEQSWMDKHPNCINYQRAYISPETKKEEADKYNKKYQVENKDEIKVQRAGHYQNNKDRIKQEVKDNFNKNKEENLKKLRDKYASLTSEEKKAKQKHIWVLKKARQSTERVKCPHCYKEMFERSLKRHNKLKHSNL
jgi:predicted GIY-YIG superfamily endonuclease